jgi:squalene synthase HpnC
MSEAPFEAPSGKGAEDENFPVGSFLLTKAVRPHVAKFYAFARAIDDVTDNPLLSSDEKLRRLDGFADAIEGKRRGIKGLEKADLLRDSLLSTGVSPQHALDLIAAFKRDSVRSRCRDWGDLMDYCTLSAAPVGRYLLDLHGESPDNYWASDALCNALQVINHLQDCSDDRRNLDRVYLPQDWMAEEGADDGHLDQPQASRALRRVLDRCLSGTEVLLQDARNLPLVLDSRSLALESGAIVALAVGLTKRLWREDPLAQRVAFGKPTAIFVALGGVGVTLLSRWRRRRRHRQRQPR